MFRQRKRRRAAGGREVAGLATIALVFFGLTVAPAAAKDRYVMPSGTGMECTQPNPCSFATGVHFALSGDTVHVDGDSGDYLGIADNVDAHSGVTVLGEGAHVPRIVFSGKGGLAAAGASLTRLDLSRSSEPSVVLFLFLGAMGSRLTVESGTGGIPVALRGGLLRDSFVRKTGGGTLAAIQTLDDNTLRNVTAVATGTDSTAISAEGISNFPEPGCAYTGTLNLKNVIARGERYDLLRAGSPNCPASIEAGHSNYRPGAVLDVDAGSLIDQGGNQTGVEPLLAPDGFHQLPGSPTIDAGIPAPENGPTDFDGEPRSQGAAPDIGADEFLVSPQPPDTVAPVGSKLRFNPRRFRPRRKHAPSVAGTSAKKRRKRSPRTSRVIYRLSEDASVRFTVRRRVIGRKKGKRCLVGKRARRLRKAKKCKKLVRVKGAFTHTGSQGANRFRFSGYVRGRRLRPGAYRMVGMPTDPSGNRGRGFRASFVIARR